MLTIDFGAHNIAMAKLSGATFTFLMRACAYGLRTTPR